MAADRKFFSIKLYLGYFSLILALVELLTTINTPYTCSGLTVKNSAEGFSVVSVARGSVGDQAGFVAGDVFTAINDFTLDYYVSTESTDEIARSLGKVYQFDTPMVFKSADGSEKKLLIPSDLHFFRRLRSLCYEDRVVFSVGFIFIILGLFCHYLLEYEQDASAFITMLYSAGLTIMNSNLYYAHPYTAVCLGELLLELSGYGLSASCLFCIRYFILLRPRRGHLDRILPIFANVYFILMIVRLITAPIGILPLLDSPFVSMSRVFMLASLLYMIITFLWLLRHIPRQSSIMLRFFLLSVVFSILPSLLFIIRHMMNRTLFNAVTETYVTIFPLLLIPIAITCSFILNKVVTFDKTAGKIMVFGCSFIMELFVVLLLNTGNLKDSDTLWHIVMLSPVLYLVMEPWIMKFLYPPVENLERILLDLEQDVYVASELGDICRKVSAWLLQVLSPLFIYIYQVGEHPGELNLLYYTDSSLIADKDELESILKAHGANASKQRLILRHPGKGISVPLLRGSDLFGYLFIGNRFVSLHNRTSESYSTTEIRMVRTVGRIMMEALMMSDIRKKTLENLRMQDMTVLGMAAMVESRDNSTGGHIRRTSEAVRIFAEKLMNTPGFSMNQEWLNMVIRAAPMHDLGKIAVDDRILRKEGAFTDEEYQKMKKHSEEGAKVVHTILDKVEDDEFRNIAENVAHYHHEKWNGLGYPAGLVGEDIPLEARIMAFADVFDALVSKRCYKEAFSYEKAYDIISNDLGSHFDPELGKAFLSCFPELIKLYNSEFSD